jgi:hypothetical protein
MRKLMFMAVTIAAVFGYQASTAKAFNFRGGHGGGGHHGGHHAGHHAHHGSHHHTGHHTHRHVHHAVHHHGDRPFTHGWYGHHAGAWGWNHGAYGWGNPWAFATLGTAAAWLGASAWENAGWGGNNSTVYTADNGNVNEQPIDQQADTGEQLAEGDETDAQAVEDQPAVAPSAAEANALARIGANDTLSGAQFLTLGVYTLAPAGQEEATGMIQLAIAKNGVLRGTFADLKTDQDQNIQGSVDKKTGRVAFTIGPEGKDVYETSIQDLTQQSGPLTIHANDGQTSEWTIAHFNSLGAENDPPYDANPAKTQQEKTSRRPNSLFDN